MAGKTGSSARRMVARLIAVGTLVGCAFVVSGMIENAPVEANKPATVRLAAAAPQARPAPQSRPVLPIATVAPAVDQAFVVKRILDLKGPLRHGDYVWDDKGVPAGPLIITVDLAAEVISVFRDGYEIGTAAVLYGAPDMPSPLGTFPIIQKDIDHVSNLYDAPMPYMLRLTNDGVAIHGSTVVRDYATHGCIGVPNEFAKRLFAQAKLGDRVIITKGKMMDLGQAITPA